MLLFHRVLTGRRYKNVQQTFWVTSDYGNIPYKTLSPLKSELFTLWKVYKLKTDNKRRVKISPKHGDFPQRRARPPMLSFLADTIRIKARTKRVNTVSEAKWKNGRKKAYGSCAAIIIFFFQWYKHLCLLGTPSSCLRCYSNVYFPQYLTASIISFELRLETVFLESFFG